MDSGLFVVFRGLMRPKLAELADLGNSLLRTRKRNGILRSQRANTAAPENNWQGTLMMRIRRRQEAMPGQGEHHGESKRHDSECGGGDR
jgi:predicted HicB family RNase H-like nuclease